jgi:soluble lytic murein transglycosylase-like protein
LNAGRGFLRHADPRGGGGTISRTVPEDIAAAQKIAREVTGGVTGAAETIAAPFVELEKKSFHLLTEKTKEEFFRTEVPFGPLIYKEAKRQDLDPTLVAAVVETESQFKSRARSGANAQGLMQLVPRTGRWMGAKNLMDPVQNVKAGTKYLKYLNERFDGDQEMVLAAYNAGEGNVRRFGGIPPFSETRNYVRKVLNSQEDYEQRVSGKVAESLEKITDTEAETR